MCMFSCSGRVCALEAPHAVAPRAPLSMQFSRQHYWRGRPFLLQQILLTQGSKEAQSPEPPALTDRFFTIRAPRKPMITINTN